MDKLGNRIALFGGTFDPIHNGHLQMARYAKDKFALDQIFFIPANKSPFKIDSTILPAQDRFAIVQKAIEDEKSFFASDFEINQKDISYSYKTVEYFKNQFPQAKLFWIMGYDAYLGLASWAKYQYLKNNLEFIVFCRNHVISPKIFDSTLKHHFIRDFNFEVSSTLIREAIKENLNESKPNVLDKWLPSSISDLVFDSYLKLR